MQSSKLTNKSDLIKTLINLTIWESKNLPTPPTSLGRYTFLKIIELSLSEQASLKDLHICDDFSSSGIRNIIMRLKQKNLINFYKKETDQRSFFVSAEPEMLDICDQYIKKIESVQYLTSKYESFIDR